MAHSSKLFGKGISSPINSPIQRQILEILSERGPMTRLDLYLTMDCAKKTVYDSMLTLRARGMVRQSDTKRTQGANRAIGEWKITTFGKEELAKSDGT